PLRRRRDRRRRRRQHSRRAAVADRLASRGRACHRRGADAWEQQALGAVRGRRAGRARRAAACARDAVGRVRRRRGGGAAPRGVGRRLVHRRRVQGARRDRGRAAGRGDRRARLEDLERPRHHGARNRLSRGRRCACVRAGACPGAVERPRAPGAAGGRGASRGGSPPGVATAVRGPAPRHRRCDRRRLPRAFRRPGVGCNGRRDERSLGRRGRRDRDRRRDPAREGDERRRSGSGDLRLRRDGQLREHPRPRRARPRKRVGERGARGGAVLPRARRTDARRAGVSDEGAAEQKKGFSFPHPVTFLAAIIVLVWIATLFIPAGEYELKDGSPVPGSFHHVPSPLDFRGKLANLALSPINGLYGVHGANGQVGPFESGSLFGGAQVFLFILAIGAFMTVVFETQALDLGIGHLAHRFRTRGALLIVVMSLLFGLLGSVMTWSDESLGFYALMIPLMFALGYDRMVTVAVVTVAPFVGAIGSTVTPFRIGVGSEAAGVTIGDGIALRLVLFVLTMTATILYTLRYARRVKADPSRSFVRIEPTEDEHVPTEAQETAPLTGRHKAIIALVIGTFVLLVFSIMPWSDLFGGRTVFADYETHTTAVKPYSWELGCWLPELSAMFIVMAIVIGVVGRVRKEPRRRSSRESSTSPARRSSCRWRSRCR